MSYEKLFASIVAIALSAAMLWVGHTLALLGRRRAMPSTPTVSAVSLGLLGIAIWWPSEFLTGGDGHTPSIQSLIYLGLAMALAAGSRAAATMVSRSAWTVLIAALLGGWLFGVIHGLIATTGTASAWGTSPSWLFGLVTAALSGALIWLQRSRGDNGRNPVSGAGSALCAGTIITIAASRSDSESGSAIAWTQVIAMAGTVFIANVLARVLREQPLHAEEAPRVHRPVASIDSLTKLPTRMDFEDRLAAQVAKADASKSSLALLFIDLDGFKPVNDTFGHSSGDLVLKQVGERLRSLSRSDDALTRIGGDEFVLLATGDPTQEIVSQIAKRLIDSVSKPYIIGDREIVISCSIGIVLYPEAGAHTKLIARADAAMYEAKRSGGGCYCFYTAAMDEDSRDKFDLVSDLRQALDKREMELFYQPKIDARSGQITAAEALLRWKHPKRGMVPPSMFIPLAERYGLISMLGNWVIEDACRQARRWRDRGLRMRVAINLSALQMRQEDIVQRIIGALERHRVHPSLLTCEITESVAMEDTKATQDTFLRLGKAGIHLSIDDFGTGYSSLSYLRRLPAEELKIDRSFVMDLESSADARSVVDAVIKLAHALNLRVVAEGVENQRQQQILGEMGCDEMQGYLFAKPMSARALLIWAIDDAGPDTTTFRASLFEDTAAFEATR